MAKEPTALAPPEPSVLRAWCYLVWLSWQRQARSQQMVWIALTLLVFSAVLVLVGTYDGRWTMRHWRLTLGAPRLTPPGGVDVAILGAVQQVMARSAFRVFSRVVVLNLFFGFLLPVWSLAFACEAMGGDRENNSLVWLLSRPIPRPAIYLARYLAQLPWSATLNLGGFAILCLCAGDLGRLALWLYWPAVLWGTLAFTALFHLFGAFFRRPAILAIVYTFFLEIILNLMPGYLKRVSLTFYARCLVYDEGGPHGVSPDNPINYMPVTGSTAELVLAGVTVILLVVGAWLFARIQITDGV